MPKGVPPGLMSFRQEYVSASRQMGDGGAIGLDGVGRVTRMSANDRNFTQLHLRW